MENEEDLSQLLFDLASFDRLTLLSAISREKQRLTNLSRIINASAQECSRHLTRLVDSGLINRDPVGLYDVTPFGKAILNLLTGVKFLVSHRRFFGTHDLSYLPRSFLERIGELEGSTYVEHFSQVLERIKNTITGGRKYVYLISDQPIVVGNTVGVSFYSRDLPVRFIFESKVDRNVLNAISKALPQSEIAFLDEIKVAMGINEQVAGVIFPNKQGDIDFGAGFYGEDLEFRAWCSELFEYYWSRARSLFQH